MLSLSPSTDLTYGPSLSETFERLRSTSRLNSTEWLDLIKVSWGDYQNFKLNKYVLPEQALENLADYFN